MHALRRFYVIAGLAGLAAGASLLASGLETPHAPDAGAAVQTIITTTTAQKFVAGCGDRLVEIRHSLFGGEWCDEAGACYPTLEDALAAACARG